MPGLQSAANAFRYPISNGPYSFESVSLNALTYSVCYSRILEFKLHNVGLKEIYTLLNTRRDTMQQEHNCAGVGIEKSENELKLIIDDIITAATEGLTQQEKKQVEKSIINLLRMHEPNA